MPTKRRADGVGYKDGSGHGGGRFGFPPDGHGYPFAALMSDWLGDGEGYGDGCHPSGGVLPEPWGGDYPHTHGHAGGFGDGDGYDNGEGQVSN